LNLAYQDGNEVFNVTQPNSVWVLEKWPQKILISHSTDSHLPYGADVFARYIYETNLLRPDIIFTTGDLLDDEKLASGWGYFQNIVEKQDVPAFYLPGNHDYSSGGIFYQRYAGPTNFSVIMGDFLLLGLNTQGGGYMTPEHLQWAEKILQENTEKIKIIGFHHPFFTVGRGFFEDVGTGGRINGSWDRIEELEDVMYYTWLDNIEGARGLLRLIEEYDIRLILTGHIHRDLIHIYNNNHYFATTSPTGGSIFNDAYSGSRLIEVDFTGNIRFDQYASEKIFNPPNSIPNGKITYYYKAANDGTETAVSVTAINDLEIELTNARLEFLVSGERPAEYYSFHKTQPKSYEVVTTAEGHYFIALFDISSQSTMDVTLAADSDGYKPSIEIIFPEDPEFGSEFPFTISAWDEGWGLQSLSSSYSTDGGLTWTVIDTGIEPILGGDVYEITFPEKTYTFTVPLA